MINVKNAQNDDVVSLSGAAFAAIADLKELAENQCSSEHIRDMYLAWMSSENLNNVEPIERPNFYESYEKVVRFLKAIEAERKL